MKKWPSLLLFIVVVLGIGWAVGYVTAPGEWYASLNKPFFNPPGWLFAPVWSILYVLIAIAGWRVWTAGETTLTSLWFIQMVLNFLWSPAFFGIQMPALALVIIIVLLVTIYAFIVKAWNRDRTSALLFLPYAAWVTFATLLNFSIVVLN
jgi:benzodiazapine receptor